MNGVEVCESLVFYLLIDHCTYLDTVHLPVIPPQPYLQKTAYQVHSRCNPSNLNSLQSGKRTCIWKNTQKRKTNSTGTFCDVYTRKNITDLNQPWNYILQNLTCQNLCILMPQRLSGPWNCAEKNPHQQKENVWIPITPPVWSESWCFSNRTTSIYYSFNILFGLIHPPKNKPSIYIWYKMILKICNPKHNLAKNICCTLFMLLTKNICCTLFMLLTKICLEQGSVSWNIKTSLHRPASLCKDVFEVLWSTGQLLTWCFKWHSKRFYTKRILGDGPEWCSLHCLHIAIVYVEQRGIGFLHAAYKCSGTKG